MDLLFTADQICEAARGNVTALCLVTTAYLKKQQISPQDFWAFTGRQFAQTWNEDITARDFVEGIAINMLSANCKLQTLSGGETRAELVLSNWPGDERLDSFGLTQEEADYTIDIFVAIGQELGFECLWEREGAEVKMMVALEK